jgi:hypothetical protein
MLHKFNFGGRDAQVGEHIKNRRLAAFVLPLLEKVAAVIEYKRSGFSIFELLYNQI